MNKIINESDPRFKLLTELFNNNSSENCYCKGGTNCNEYYIPKELVLNEYKTSSIQVLKYPSSDRTSIDNWVNSNRFKNILQITCNLSYQEYCDLIWYHNNDILSRPKCPICGKGVKFHAGYYSKYCGLECRNSGYVIPPKTKNLTELLNIYFESIIDSDQIILESDPRYNNLSSIFKTYNYELLSDGTGKNSIYYFIPPELVLYELETGSIVVSKFCKFDLNSSDYTNWINNKSFEKILNATCHLTSQEYFDLLSDHNNYKSKRHKCMQCGHELSFVSLSCGYGTHSDHQYEFCCNNCKNQYYLDNRILNVRGIPVDYKCKKSDKIFHLKSLLELALVKEFENYSIVESITYEPADCVIPFYDPDDMIFRTYHPDFKIVKVTGEVILLEVKPESQKSWKINQLKFEAAKKFCDERNWTFEIWTDYDLEYET